MTQTIEWFSFDPPCAGFKPGLVAHDAGYIMGALEPKHPVPTLQYRVRFKSRETIIYNLNNAPRNRVVRFWGRK